jgi:methionine sulfoxide reductase heme-binding subunit
VPDAAVAVLLTGAVLGILVLRVHAGVDAALVEMPAMAHAGVWAYTTSQAFGFASLAWSWLTILLGLSLPARLWQGRPRTRQVVERLHRSTSLTVLGLLLAHAVLLVWDGMGDTPLSVLVPYTGSYAAGRFPTALGIIALYLAVLVGPSFYLRHRLGRRLWRITHRYVMPAVYALGVWHTFLYGSDVKAGTPLFVTLWAIQVPIAVLFGLRLLGSARRAAMWAPAWGWGIGLAAGAVTIVALADGQGHGAMGSGNPWLPCALMVIAALVYVVILVVHVGHLRDIGIRGRVWHLGHVLMALGMIDMFVPTGRMPVPAGVGAVVFALAALVMLGFTAALAVRGERVGWLWPVAGFDLAAMAYMFTLPGAPWLTGLLVGWFVLQAAGWATGVLPGVGVGQPPDRSGASVGSGYHDLSVRVTLAAMGLGMAYMFLAMQLGMAPMGNSPMPGMSGM